MSVQKKPSRTTKSTPTISSSPTVSSQPKAPRRDWVGNAENWVAKHTRWVLGLLVLLWAVERYQLFTAVADTPIRFLYLWNDSDNRFFDDWAKRIAYEDFWGRTPYHPYHTWHREFAEYYFQKHPDALAAYNAKAPSGDSTFVAGKALWNDWYGGVTLHQEPLYPYLLAAVYKLTGDGAYWMLVLQCLIGIVSGLLIWSITRRHFGNIAALFSGVLYFFAGIILFQEAVLLRTAWTVFFTLLNVWSFDRALIKKRDKDFALAGLTLGLGFLMQSTFSLLLIGLLAVNFWQQRSTPLTWMRHAALTLGVFMLVFSPVLVRNAVVGAPLLSSSSVGAITFAAANVKEALTINNWYPEKEKCAEIMGQYQGKFGQVAIAALRSNESLGAYLKLVWEKATSLIAGIEFSSNENYYFYRLYVPILDWTPIRFSLLCALGTAGLLLALYARKRAPGLYLGVLIQVAILLGFYVSGRLRTPLAALLIPFAAYALSECLHLLRDYKVGAIKVAVVGLCLYLLHFLQINYQTFLRSVDYQVLYDKYYLHRLDKAAVANNWAEASKVHLEFMRYEPEFTKQLHGMDQLRYQSDVNLARYVARHYQIQAQIHDQMKEGHLAKTFREREAELRVIVKRSEGSAK